MLALISEMQKSLIYDMSASAWCFYQQSDLPGQMLLAVYLQFSGPSAMQIGDGFGYWEIDVGQVVIRRTLYTSVVDAHPQPL